jgi:hypothetical protein
MCADTPWALPWRATVQQAKEYAKDRAGQIDWEKNDPDAGPGDPYPYQGGTNPFADLLAKWNKSEKAVTQASGPEAMERFDEAFYSGTTSVQAADEEGWVVSITPSGGWIPAVIAGNTGVGMSQRAQSFVSGRLETDIGNRDPEDAADPLADGLAERRQFRDFGDDRDVAVHHPISLVADPVDNHPQQLDTVGVAPAGFARREVAADIPLTDGAQQGVSERVQDDIRITESVQAEGKGDLLATEDEPSPLDQRMDIVALTDAKRHGPSSSRNKSSINGRSRRCVSFGFGPVASTARISTPARRSTLAASSVPTKPSAAL